MPRTATPVNKDALQSAIKDAISQKPKHFTDLCKISADQYNNKFKGKNDKTISFSVVIARIKEWKIDNPFGDGTRESTREASQVKPRAATVPVPRGKPTTAPANVSDKDVIKNHFQELERITPPKYKGLVAKVKSGSKVSALKLHCLACTGFQRKEVRLCTALRCPVWTLRPYQGKANAAAETDDPNYVDHDDVNTEEDETEEDDD